MRQNPRQPRARSAAAFSLLEMVLSLSVLGIVFTAVGSVFVLTAKVIPAPGSVLAAGVEQSRALTRVVEDLQAARYITASTAHSVTIVVDDRDGDLLPDRLRYAWSGTPGDPLTLSINGSADAVVVDGVAGFQLVAENEPRVDTVPSISTVSEEQALYSYTSATTPATVSITQDWRLGQVFRPALPGDAVAYTVTRYRSRVRRNGGNSGGVYAQLRTFDMGTMTLQPVESQLLVYESEFGASYGWYDFVFPEPVTYAAGAYAAFTVGWEFGLVAADFEYDDAGGNNILWSTDGGNNYTLNGSKNMMAEAYGTVTTSAPAIELTRTVMTRMVVTLAVGDAPAQSVSARLYREPGVHSAVWDAGFDASPVGIDMDGNGADWQAQSGGSAASFQGGRWVVDGRIDAQPIHDFTDPTVVDLVMGATTNGSAGARFRIHADRSGGLLIPIIIDAGRDATGSHFVRLKTDPPGVVRLEATGLGANLPRVRLLIAPAENVVGLIVNGEPVGAYAYEPISADGLNSGVILKEAADGVFDRVSIRVGGTAVVTTGGSP